MKKIINNKLYNTDTANLLCSYSNGYGINDFQHFQEDLYIKQNGEYFLHGSGGAMSKYSKNCGGYSTGGSTIIPLTCKGAKNWAAEHLAVDEFLELFGTVEE